LLREPPGKTCPVPLFTAQDESEMYDEHWASLRALYDDVIIKGMNMDEAQPVKCRNARRNASSRLLSTPALRY
jgi:hypothetical protein